MQNTSSLSIYHPDTGQTLATWNFGASATTGSAIARSKSNRVTRGAGGAGLPAMATPVGSSTHAATTTRKRTGRARGARTRGRAKTVGQNLT